MPTASYESMSGQTAVLTEDEFIARFAPEGARDGSVYVQRYWFSVPERQLLERADAERRLWTYVNDGAGNGAPVQGYHVVNREFYIVCEVPYAQGDHISVIGDIDYCTICGERFADSAHPDNRIVTTRSPADPSVCLECVER